MENEKVIKCDACGKVLKPDEICYKAFLKERYYCELHEMLGRDLDEDKLR